MAGATGKGKEAIFVDGEGNLTETSEILKELGYMPKGFSDGTKLQKYCDRQKAGWKPELILIDVIIPGGSGFELVRSFHHGSSTSKSCLLMFSKYDSAEDRHEALNAGASALLPKPLTKEALEQALEEIRIRKIKGEIGTEVFDINHL